MLDLSNFLPHSKKVTIIGNYYYLRKVNLKKKILQSKSENYVFYIHAEALCILNHIENMICTSG